MKIYHVQKVQYDNGSLAVRAFIDGEPAVLSVNLVDYGLVPADSDEFYVKDYSESMGLPQAIAEQGIATPIATVEIGPFNSRCVLMKLIDPTVRRS